MLSGPALCCVPAITRSDALTQSSCHHYKGTQTPSLLLSFTFAFFFFFFCPLSWNTDNLFHVKWPSGLPDWLFIASKITSSSLLLPWMFPTAKIYYSWDPLRLHSCTFTLRRCHVEHFVQSGACWNCKANWEPWGVKPMALCGQLCSTVIQCGTMLWSKEEESLSSGSEWAGWTQTVAGWRFLLWSLCLSVFLLCQYLMPTRGRAAAE